MYSTQSAAPVPAWKRLGLKLKGPASSPGPTSATSSNEHQAHSQPNVNGPASSPFGNKRKRHDAPPFASPASLDQRKKVRTDNLSPDWQGQKSVSFAHGTKDPANGLADQPTAEPKQPKRPKREKREKTAQPIKAALANGADKSAKKQPKPPNLAPSIAYLKQWQTAREQWKFNKNHQTLLVKYLFDTDNLPVPSSDVSIFYAYIRDIQGFVRQRLRETALEIRAMDERQGLKMFPEGTEDAEQKQQAYEGIIRELLADKTRGSFDEKQFVLRMADPDVKSRVLKRMRAEMVLDELSDSDESTAPSGTSTTVSSGQDTGMVDVDVEAGKRMKLNDGSQQKVARRRKQRTVAANDEFDQSDSESEGEGGSGASSSSSSSSSSSESSDDEDDGAQLANNEELDTSSSSSSSSSAAESDSGSDEEGEDDDDEDDDEDDDDDDDDNEDDEGDGENANSVKVKQR